MTRLELAICELNIKFKTLAAMHQIEEKSDMYDAMEKALEEMKADIENINYVFKAKIRFDNNYSWTLGTNAYGIYKSIDEMDDIGSIIDQAY